MASLVPVARIRRAAAPGASRAPGISMWRGWRERHERWRTIGARGRARAVFERPRPSRTTRRVKRANRCSPAAARMTTPGAPLPPPFSPPPLASCADPKCNNTLLPLLSLPSGCPDDVGARPCPRRCDGKGATQPRRMVGLTGGVLITGSCRWHTLWSFPRSSELSGAIAATAVRERPRGSRSPPAPSDTPADPIELAPSLRWIPHLHRHLRRRARSHARSAPGGFRGIVDGSQGVHVASCGPTVATEDQLRGPRSGWIRPCGHRHRQAYVAH